MKNQNFDPTMRSTEKDECFEMSLGGYTATVFKPRRGKKITLSNGVHTVAWEYVTKPSADEDGAKKKRPRVALERSEQGERESFTYRNIDTATDLEYILDRKGIKENIIVKEKSDEYRYTFLLRTGDLSVRVSEDDGALELYEAKSGEDAKTLFTIPAPFMTDADGARSDDVWYELEESTKGKYTFTVVAEDAWINDSYRAFPVTIDPQLIIQENLEDNGLTLETEEELTLIGGDAAGGVATPFTLPPGWTGDSYYVTGIELSAYDVALDVGNTLTLTASVCPQDVPNTSLVWYSTDEDIATVVDGVIYAHNEGSTYVYALATDGGGGQSAYCNVCVLPRKFVTEITVSAPKCKLEIDESVRLTANVKPANASDPEICWESNAPSIASVNAISGWVTAKSAGTAKIYARAQDGSGKCGTFTITVNRLPVSFIILSEEELTIPKGTSATLTATVYPPKATNKSIKWYSCNESIATIDENTGVVTAEGTPGQKVTVYAEAQDGTNVCGYCELTVLPPIPVESITLSLAKKDLVKGETFALAATVLPEDAYDKSISWHSSNSSVATVNTQTGVITAISDGTATITARSLNYNKSATCTIVVDSREKAFIKKDGHSFYVQFADGKIWRHIGIDLSKRKEYYGDQYLNPIDEAYYYVLGIKEQRYLDNITQTFSVNQIAYSYLFDPLGIEYYMRHDACENMSLEELLYFKDAVYEAIFGTSDRNRNKFYFTLVDGEPEYKNSWILDGTAVDRTDIHSNAEALFGFHAIYDWDWSKFIKSLCESLFDLVTEIPVIGNMVQLYQFLFHATGLLNGDFSSAPGYTLSYQQAQFENNVKARYISKYGEEFAENAKLTVHWALTLTKILFDSALSAFSILNPQDITIYRKVNLQPQFATIIEGFDGNVTMQDIMNQVSPD